MDQRLAEAIKKFDTGKPMTDLDQKVKEATDIITKQFWLLDQFEQLIVEKANIFVVQERPNEEYVGSDANPTLYYHRDLRSVTTDDKIAQICNVVRNGSARDALILPRPLCSPVVTAHLRRVLSDEHDSEHDRYLVAELEEAQKRVEIARETADIKMECDSMTTEAPNVKEQPTGIVNKAKKALFGFIQAS